MSRFVAFAAVVAAIGWSGACAQTGQAAQKPAAASDKPAVKPETAGRTAAPESSASPSTPGESAKPSTAEKPETTELQGTIRLPSSGEYIWWTTATAGKKAEPPQVVKSDTISWKAGPPTKPSPLIYVYNPRTGLEAVIEAGVAASSAEHKLVEGDFDHVRRVAVTISAEDGKPVRAASVVLQDADGTTTRRVIDEKDEGKAQFFDVPKGSASLTAGAGDVTITQDVTIGGHVKNGADTFKIVLAGGVPTIAPVKKTPPGAKPKPEAPSHSLGGTIFTALVSFLLLAVVVYFVYSALKSRNVTLKGALEKAGVPLTDDGEMAPASTPEIAGPPPLDPNLVGPAPAAAPSAPSVAASPQISGPKLVGVAGSYAGSVFQLSAPSQVIGRDPTCDIPLPSDGTASRRHARFTQDGGSVTIHDEGSSNGTFVNGERVEERRLSSGDEVQVGSTRFRYEA